MATIYCCRANTDKEKFIFDQIAKRLKENNADGSPIQGSRGVFLIVPEQYTLQAERNAFLYLDVDVLMDLEVLSQSRLSHRVMSETGGTTRTPIDQYGRQMLLTKIILEQNQNLAAFRGMQQRQSFIEMVNDLIAEMKQYDTGPEDLKAILATMKEETILYRKLQDVCIIFEEYEKALQDQYLDNEDFQELFLSKIQMSKQLCNTEIWVDGFDYFTPKNQRILLELMRYAQNVNVVLTALPPGKTGFGQAEKTAGVAASDSLHENPRDKELFELPQRVMMQLMELAAERGVGLEVQQISKEYEKQTDTIAAAIHHLERELYAYPYRTFEKKQQALHICQASNFYTEAETISTRITELVRDQGMRYRDIVVICNDLDVRGSILKRTLADYGIPCFIDQKRSLVNHPGIELILSLLSICSKGWQFEDVFRFLKTGLTTVGMMQDDAAKAGLEQADFSINVENLENYAYQYRIRGNRWKKEFTSLKNDKTGNQAEQLEQLNEIRSQLVSLISDFESALPKNKTVRDKTLLLYNFLQDTLLFPGKLELLTSRLADYGQLEYSEETAQVWATVLHIFDQIVELIGDATLSTEEYQSILQTGFESMEIGLIPTSIDEVLIGTMQRTRTGHIKALFVAGANDGVLPSDAAEEGILNEDEKSVLHKRHKEICKQDRLRTQEEQLAIYRNLCRAQQYLWVGFSASDQDGNELKQSMITDKIRKLFPDVPLEKDIINQNQFLDLAATPGSAIRHLSEAFRRSLDGEVLAPEWKTLYNWLRNPLYKEWNLYLSRMEHALLYTNSVKRLDRQLIEALYLRNGNSIHSISPSRLERFSRCPFSHFILYGIRPEERRIYDIAGRELGDLYHECLMRLSNELTQQNQELQSPESLWMQMTEDSCRQRVQELISEITEQYRNRTVTEEEMQYRTERISEVCWRSAWALVQHVQQGRIKHAYFEADFGRGEQKQFPAVEITLSQGNVLIEGKIDRVDVLGDPQNPNTSYVKIIDYKSGAEKFNTEEAIAGWKLQLMIYLRAAMGGVQKTSEAVKPAGIFYFGIAEPMIDAGEWTEEERVEKIADKIKRSFRLDGVVLQNENVIQSLDLDFDKRSDIVPVKRTKEGYSGTSASNLLSEEDFNALCGAVDQTIEELCSEFLQGNIDIKPKKRKTDSACTYCEYKSICNYEGQGQLRRG